MAVVRPFQSLLGLFLLRLCHEGCWGISMDLSTCTQLQLNSVMLNCIGEYNEDDQDNELWKECLLTEGLDAAMQCVKAEILEEMKDEDASVFTFQSEMMLYKIAEFTMSVLLESVVDCLEFDEDVMEECMFNLAIERLMVRITTIIEDNFQHPEYVSCWARGTLNGAKECAELLPSHLTFGVGSAYHQWRHKDFTLCTLRYSINSTVDC
ncbi:hypothetical protein MATL_G00193020 [Megalops atlanticus]|uniref:Secreted protein n=1 Tax=Megalops atlanticus TaxID=7932 RepID=A0A9D3SZ23_MEGAT|nr:hypothetical protein MATL_G00193020 [Megalops atlanticus]